MHVVQPGDSFVLIIALLPFYDSSSQAEWRAPFVNYD